MDYSGSERRQATSVQLEMAQTLGSLVSSVEDLRRELLGNGQPGRLQILEKQVSNHNKLIWTATGGVTVGFHFLKGILAKLGFSIG